MAIQVQKYFSSQKKFTKKNFTKTPKKAKTLNQKMIINQNKE